MFRLKTLFCRCYVNKSWNSPCSCRLQCSATVIGKQRIKDIANGENVQLDVPSKKHIFWSRKNLLFRRKLHSVKVHMGYADISFLFKGGCSAYKMRQIKSLRNFSSLHLENKYIRLFHSDLQSLNLKGSGKKRTIQALYPLQLVLCVPTINSRVFTTAISPSLEKGAKRTTTCRLQINNKSTHCLQWLITATCIFQRDFGMEEPEGNC